MGPRRPSLYSTRFLNFWTFRFVRQRVLRYLPYIHTVNTSHNPQPQHTAPATSKKHWHHDLPRPPASSSFNLQVSAIAVRCAIDIDHRNIAMQFFYIKQTVSFYLIDYYSMPLTGAHWDKRYVFLVNTCAFFWPLHRINAHWPQLSADIFFADAARVLIKFWHDFGQGEWGRHCHGCRWSEEGI